MLDKRTAWNIINGKKSKNNENLRKNVELFLSQYRENQISRDELIKKLGTFESTKILNEEQISGLLKIADMVPKETNISNEIGKILEQTKAFWLDHINEYVVERGLFQALDNLQDGKEKQAYLSLLNEYSKPIHQDNNDIDLECVLNQARSIIKNAEKKGMLKSDRTLLDVGAGEKGMYGLMLQSLGYNNVTLQDVSSENIDALKMAQSEGKIPRSVELKTEDIIDADETTQYDRIVASFVAHHIESKEDKQKFFDKIYNLLKPGGKAIVSFFMPNSNYMNGGGSSFPSFYDNHPVSNISHENFVKFIEHTFGSNYRFLGNGVIKGKNLFYGTYELKKEE